MTQSGAKPVHAYASTEQLVEQYVQAYSQTAHGILHALGDRATYDIAPTVAVEFLCRVGAEGKGFDGLWEKESGLRNTARKVLIRRVVATFNDAPHLHLSQGGALAIQELLTFFSKDERHYPYRNENDHKVLSKFLTLCWERDWERKGSCMRELTGATINAGCADLLPNKPLVRAMLYEHLLKSVPSRSRNKVAAVSDPTLIQITKLCGVILSVDGHHRDREKQLATRLLQLEAQT